jgi:hypothetical protein
MAVVNPLRNTSKWLYRVADVDGIDGAVRGTGELTTVLSRWIARLQVGHVGIYALVLACGAIILMAMLMI